MTIDKTNAYNCAIFRAEQDTQGYGTVTVTATIMAIRTVTPPQTDTGEPEIEELLAQLQHMYPHSESLKGP